MISGEIVRAGVLVSGRVQGVSFRRFARNAADRFGVDCSPINSRVFIIETPNRQTFKT
ncbi:hypothetical protein FXV91_05195 [Methanosarcina sp. DH2]|nr:hypothetical protein [Methanosarcina sp. DH2]